jgi:hypothetical protein
MLTTLWHHSEIWRIKGRISLGSWPLGHEVVAAGGFMDMSVDMKRSPNLIE